jgi:hypothetical protein
MLSLDSCRLFRHLSHSVLCCVLCSFRAVWVHACLRADEDVRPCPCHSSPRLYASTARIPARSMVCSMTRLQHGAIAAWCYCSIALLQHGAIAAWRYCSLRLVLLQYAATMQRRHTATAPYRTCHSAVQRRYTATRAASGAPPSLPHTVSLPRADSRGGCLGECLGEPLCLVASPRTDTPSSLTACSLCVSAL